MIDDNDTVSCLVAAVYGRLDLHQVSDIQGPPSIFVHDQLFFQGQPNILILTHNWEWSQTYFYFVYSNWIYLRSIWVKLALTR